jgi:hypothetical protein
LAVSFAFWQLQLVSPLRYGFMQDVFVYARARVRDRSVNDESRTRARSAREAQSSERESERERAMTLDGALRCRLAKIAIRELG